MHADVKVSVVVPTFCAAATLDRLVGSLDRQTLPQDEFEVIFVDDGSTDDTVERLLAIAATRPNTTVERLEHSGWPGRPRNVGVGRARGDYVLFLDADDALFPDGLRAAHAYAVATGADLLNPKECKTGDVWWGMASMELGNAPDVRAAESGGIGRLIPLGPHKLYRRRLLDEHAVRFPEGPRLLWEDWYVNLEAFRAAEVVSVLADEPVYLYHAAGASLSHSYRAAEPYYWDRLQDLLEHVSRTFARPEDRGTRSAVLAHAVRNWVIGRGVRVALELGHEQGRAARAVLERAGRLITRFVSDDVFRLLSRAHRAQLFLVVNGDLAPVAALDADDRAIVATSTVERLGWDAGRLAVRVRTAWDAGTADAPAVVRHGGRFRRSVRPEVARLLPPELLDVPEEGSEIGTRLAIRSRTEHVTWAVPVAGSSSRLEHGRDRVPRLVAECSTTIDLQTSAGGRPLEDTVWDVRARSTWLGLDRGNALRYRGDPLPALVHGRGAVAYSNKTRALSIDLAGRLRNLSMDARPRGEGGPVEHFSVPLENVAVSGRTELTTAPLLAVGELAVDGSTDGGAAPGDGADRPTAPREVEVRVMAVDGVARLVGGAHLGPGRYVLHSRFGADVVRTRHVLVVGDDGGTTFGEAAP